jgi:radical SAM superfamily enzyme YgiQ (UPF0313 family)
MNTAIEKFFIKYKPTLVGFGVLSGEFSLIKEISKFLKSRFSISTFMGGYHATIDSEKCLEYADYVLRGEAEDTLLDICKKMKNDEDFLDMPNMVYKQGRKIIKNPMRMPEQNLDKYPFPKNVPEETYIFNDGNISLMDEPLFKKYSRYTGTIYSFTASRGCNFQCSFCIHSFNAKLYKEENLNVPKIRTRSVDNCMEELKLVKINYPNTIYINMLDDNFFGHDVEWIREFSEKYKKDIGLPMIARATPTFFTEEKAGLMKECGLIWIMTGLQTGSERIQREIYHRYINNEQFLKMTEIVHKFGFVGEYDVILDNPFEAEDDLLKTIDVILRIKKPYKLLLYSLMIFQGTALYDMAKEKNIEMDDPTKSYLKFKPTYLNRVIRLIPLYPKPFITFLVHNRKNKVAKILLPFFYHISITTLEPPFLLKLVYISFNRNIMKTIGIIKPFLKTAMQRIVKQNMLAGKHPR